MKRKFTIYNLQFTIIAFICTLYIIHYTFLISPVSALQSCLSQSSNPRVTQGLITTPSFPDTGNKFGNPTGTCVVDAKAPFTKILTYAELKSLYYDQNNQPSCVGVTGSQPCVKVATIDCSSGCNQGVINQSIKQRDTQKLFYLNGSLTINNDSSLDTPANPDIPVVIVINGDLTIRESYTYIGASSAGGTVFVVSGDVYIAPGVTQIDAVIISSGTIYTAGANCTTSSVNVGASTNALTVNGSLISLDAGKVIFCRTLNNNNNPAEVINQQPKYLVILRNLMSNTKQKWSEIQ